MSVDAGWYTLYAIPTEREWRVACGVNRGVRRWGTPIDSTVRKMDIGEGILATALVAESEDLLRMQLVRTAPTGADLVVQWDRTQVKIPIVLASER